MEIFRNIAPAITRPVERPITPEKIEIKWIPGTKNVPGKPPSDKPPAPATEK